MRLVQDACDDSLPAAAVLTQYSHLQEEMIEDPMGEDSAEAAIHPQEPAPALYDEEFEEEEYIAPRKGKKKTRLRKGNPNKKSVKNMLDALGVHAQHKSDADFNGHCAHCNGTGEACLKCSNTGEHNNKEKLIQLHMVACCQKCTPMLQRFRGFC